MADAGLIRIVEGRQHFTNLIHDCKKKIKRRYAGISNVRKIVYEQGLQKLAV